MPVVTSVAKKGIIGGSVLKKIKGKIIINLGSLDYAQNVRKEIIGQMSVDL
jgi:hypothetical protein